MSTSPARRPTASTPSILVATDPASPPALLALLAELAAGGAAVATLELPGSPQDMAARIAAHLTGEPVPDALVNLVGAPATPTPLEELATAEWQRALTANLTRSLLTCQGVGKAMLAAGRGTVVTVLGGQPRDARSVVIDEAAVGLMRVLGVEWAPLGVRVVTIRPGGVPSEARDREVAAAVAYLVSEEASYVTASELEVRAP